MNRRHCEYGAWAMGGSTSKGLLWRSNLNQAFTKDEIASRQPANQPAVFAMTIQKQKTMKKQLFLSIFSFFFFTIQAQTIYVDASNNTGIEDGSREHPFNTVEEGIETAVAGDSVFILSGKYLLNQYLKDGLVICGEDSVNTIIEGDFINSDLTMTNYTELTKLTCEGIKLTMGDGNATIRIKDCRITNYSCSSGGGYHLIVENCIIGGYIFNASGTNYLTIKSNHFLDGYISDLGGSPEDEDAHIVEGNVFFYSGYESTVDAAINAHSKQISIKNNTIDIQGVASGIHVTAGPPTNIIGNQITINGGSSSENTFGINSSSGEGVVTGNNINGGYVGYWSASAASLFENNNITNCHYGLISAGFEEIKNNEVSFCTGHGMVLRGVKGPVSNNDVHDNDSAGIFMIYPCDLGGGEFDGPGMNKIQNNGYYDLIVNYKSLETDTIFAKHNSWDHNTLEDILAFDVKCEECENIFIDVLDFNPSSVINIDGTIKNLFIYPNPTKDKYKVKSVKFKVEDATIEIYDLNGRKLLEKQIKAGTEEIEMDVSHLNSGLYFCRVQTEDGSVTKKLIIK